MITKEALQFMADLKANNNTEWMHANKKRYENYKIDYHNREDFSNHIRFNQSIEHSKNRIQELTTTKEEIKKMIADSKSKNLNLVINSTITIRLEK